MAPTCVHCILLILLALLGCMGAPSSSVANPLMVRALGDLEGNSLSCAFARLSGPSGDEVPFAREGLGLAGQRWYGLTRWAALGIGLGFYRARFDRGAFCSKYGVLDDDRLSSSSYTITETTGEVLLEPLDLGALHPFFVGGLQYCTWREKYSYDDLVWGPWFPSGTYLHSDRTISGLGWSAGGGIRLAGSARWGVFADLQWVRISARTLDGHWSRLRAGLNVAL